MQSMVLHGQQNTSSSKKIKAIPRKSSRHVQTPKDLNILVKEGIRVKNLKIGFKDEETRSPEALLVKKLVKYCNYLHGIQVLNVCNKEIVLLLKLQCRMRNIKDLQLDLINLQRINVSHGLETLLVRFKHLKKYSSEAKVDSNIADVYESFRLDTLSVFFKTNWDKVGVEKRFPFVFDSKTSLSCEDSKKTGKMILCMRNDLQHLISIEGDQSSFEIRTDFFYDLRTGNFDEKIFGFIKNYKCLLDHLTLTAVLKSGLSNVLSLLEANGLNIKSQFTLREVLKEKTRFERFLSRKGARILLDSSSIYTWDSLLAMLHFSQEMFSAYGSFIDFKDFTFDFHAPMDVKRALLDHFKLKEMKWRRVIFSFKTHSIGWSREDEKLGLEEMINEVCKEENKNRYSEIQWNVSFTNVLEEKSVPKVKDEIFRVIQDLIQRQQKAKILTRYVLRIEFDAANNKNFFSFLALFGQIPNTISILQLDLYPELLNKIKKIIQNSKSSAYIPFDDEKKLRDSFQKGLQLSPQVDIIKSYAIQLKENNCFGDVFIPHLFVFGQKEN